VTRFCEHTNTPSGPINDGEFLISLIEYELLKKSSASWNYILTTTFPVLYYGKFGS
jgi:hypothetical protein